MGFVDLRPSYGESFPTQEFSFSLGLFTCHCISILETAVYKAGFGFLFCFGGGSFVLFFYLPQIEMKSASHEVFC